ncbi:MAG: tol-pal system protein YbgF [Deltaproteobacteria bacterium]|nr:tol-pal system protein YbgF [Deltaproteobacteria bacterium]
MMGIRQVRRSGRWIGALAAMLALLQLGGCVTVAEFRKLEREVTDMKRGGGPTEASRRTRVADLSAQVDSLEAEVRDLGGRLEVLEHRIAEALREAQAARGEVAALVPPDPAADGSDLLDGPPEESGTGANADEIEAYRAAYDAWRSGDSEICVDRFSDFLQTYPASAYADDSAYWLADCYFKEGDYKTAVLRFDDVVSRYPTGNKAADALYRQGEALLRMGPGYGKAAGKAFERVVREYPDSGRAAEANKQLDLLGSG